MLIKLVESEIIGIDLEIYRFDVTLGIASSNRRHHANG